jgi:hypothetical protein
MKIYQDLQMLTRILKFHFNKSNILLYIELKQIYFFSISFDFKGLKLKTKSTSASFNF